MAGYLEQYGAGEEQRERRGKIVKVAAIVLAAVVLIGGALVFNFYNFREERQVKQFMSRLDSRDYKAAYALFGCTDAKPCSNRYPFDKFMEDWGPSSGHSGFAQARITRSRSCGSGVLLTVDYGGNQQEKLWVERGDMTIGFPPVQGCPAKP
jgi:hypothetical protein